MSSRLSPPAIAIVLTLLAGCGQTSQPQQDDLTQFSLDLFRAAKANNIDALVESFCIADPESMVQSDELENDTLGNVADIEALHRSEIAIFIRSYEDELIGEPVSCVAATSEKFDATWLVIWARMPDETYRGVLIHGLVRTPTGFRVNKWIGPIADPTKDASLLIRQKAILRSDTPEGCVFPLDTIQYETEFVKNDTYV